MIVDPVLVLPEAQPKASTLVVAVFVELPITFFVVVVDVGSPVFVVVVAVVTTAVVETVPVIFTNPTVTKLV